MMINSQCLMCQEAHKNVKTRVQWPHLSHALVSRAQKATCYFATLLYANGRRTCRVSARSVLKINYLCGVSLSRLVRLHNQHIFLGGICINGRAPP